MSRDQIDVSVVMAAYNSGHTIGAAIESVWAQSLSNWELIIVDDASSDNTCAVADTYAAQDQRIHIIRMTRNSGQSVCRNMAVSLSRGRYIAVLDSDDIAETHRFQHQVTILDKLPIVALLAGRAYVIDESGRRTGEIVGKSLRYQSLFVHDLFSRASAIVHPTVMMRSEVLRSIPGPYSEEFVYAQDKELWGRLLYSHEAFVDTRIVLNYRKHANAVSAKNRERQRQFATTALSEHVTRVLRRDISLRLLDLITGECGSARRTYKARKCILHTVYCQGRISGGYYAWHVFKNWILLVAIPRLRIF